MEWHKIGDFNKLSFFIPFPLLLGSCHLIGQNRQNRQSLNLKEMRVKV